MSYFRKGLVIASLTFLSRIFGLFRELVIANFFGTSMYADAVNTAFKFPNLFRRIFGEGALSSVFIPIYSEKLTKKEDEAIKFASEIYTLLIIALTIISVMLIIFMPYVMHLLAPGFKDNPEKFEIAVLLTRITTPYLLFVSVSAIIGAIHNSNNKFVTHAFMPVILNITIIIACFFKGNEISRSIYVALGIFAGGICQVLFMSVTSKYFKIKYSFVHIKNLSKSAYKLLKNMVPATMGSSVTQINIFISNTISSFAPGAISVLSYADRIYQFPLSIIGICFGTILLPALSRHYSTGDTKGAVDVQTKSLKLSFLLSIAAGFGILMLSDLIIHVIYERGQFTNEDTIKTSQTISIFAFGLPAFILTKVLTPIFYANQDPVTPFRITLVSMLSNIILNLILIWEFKYLGIAAGTVIAGWINIILTIIYLKKKQFRISNENLTPYILKVLLCSAIMSLFLYYFSQFSNETILTTTSFVKFIYLFAAIILGGLVYLISILALKITTINEIRSLIR